MRAYLTRDDDYFVPLQRARVQGRRVRADLFVSIQRGRVAIKPSASGSSVFALSQRGASSAAGALDGQQGKTPPTSSAGSTWARTTSKVAKVLLDLSTPAQIHDSLKLGSVLLDRDQEDQSSAQGRRRTGRLRGVEGAGHSVHPGGNRLHQQSHMKKRC